MMGNGRKPRGVNVYLDIGVPVMRSCEDSILLTFYSHRTSPRTICYCLISISMQPKHIDQLVRYAATKKHYPMEISRVIFAFRRNLPGQGSYLLDLVPK